MPARCHRNNQVLRNCALVLAGAVLLLAVVPGLFTAARDAPDGTVPSHAVTTSMDSSAPAVRSPGLPRVPSVFAIVAIVAMAGLAAAAPRRLAPRDEPTHRDRQPLLPAGRRAPPLVLPR
jgi:hypothetical protein